MRKNVHQCIFVHEDSTECKFTKGCERMLCMIQQEEKDEPDEEDVESDDERDVDKNDNDEENTITINVIEPSLKIVKEAMDKLNILLQNKLMLLNVIDTFSLEQG